jgi:hypothetical protein
MNASFSEIFLVDSEKKEIVMTVAPGDCGVYVKAIT